MHGKLVFALCCCIMAMDRSALGAWEAISEPLEPSWGAPLALMSDPGQQDHWFIGTANGVAESADGGSSFVFTPHHFFDGRFVAVVMDRDYPDWLWATLHPFGYGATPSDFYRSTDRGASWEAISHFNDDDWQLIHSFGERNVLLAFHISSYTCSNTTYELNRSTDGGLTWTVASIGEIDASLVAAGRSDLLYLRFYQRAYSEDTHDMFRSSDLGATWQPLANLDGPYAALVTGGPSGDDLLLLTEFSYANLGFYFSGDRGNSWTDVAAGSHEYYYELAPNGLFLDHNGAIFYFHDFNTTNARIRPTVPIARRAAGGGAWRPACWDFPAGASFPATVPFHLRLVAPVWEPDSIYTLLQHAEDVRVYRFSPSNSPPLIAMAGWNPDRIYAAAGGEVTLFAYASDPENDPLTVELMYEDLPTGIFLEDRGGGLFQTAITFQPGEAAPGYLMVELQATDARGLKSMIWPFVRIGYRDCYPVVQPPQWNSYAAHFSAGGPSIFTGGWGYSGASNAGFSHGNLVVFAGDPDGAADLNLIEIMWQGLPTGILLRNSAHNAAYWGDFAYYDGSYGMSFTTTGIPTNAYYLELQARDRGGDRSGLWPYLTVIP